MIKKSLFLIFALLLITSAYASVKIEKEAITDTIITDINNSAVFNFKIQNLGETDTFRIYSLIGAYFSPSENITIKSGETKQIQFTISLSPTLMSKSEIFYFVYKIEGQISGIQEEQIGIKIFPLRDALEINSYNLNIDSESAVIYVKNLAGYDFNDISANFHSAFFNVDKKFSIGKYEKKEFNIELNKEETKKLIAGDYSLTTNINVLGLNQKYENSFKFTEKANIKTTEDKSGFLIRRLVTSKTNEGNLPMVVQVKVKKSVLSRLFTTYNIEPSKVDRKGMFVEYLFQKEIKPSETFVVKSNTNWFYPLILLLLVSLIAYLVKVYTSSDLVVKKRAVFVKTTGGEFALKIMLTVKAKKYIEKVNVVDRLPGMVKIFDKFGGINPTRFDENSKRIEWNLDSMQQYEERVLSYVIFSKIGFVGRFELPSATAFYETEGKIHESESNKVLFLTDTPKSVKHNF